MDRVSEPFPAGHRFRDMDTRSWLENLVNECSDSDWTWWPFRGLRPPPHQAMGAAFAARFLASYAALILLLSACLAFAEPQALFAWDRHTGHASAGWSAAFLFRFSAGLLRAYGPATFFGTVALLALGLWPMAFYWNRRARRLNGPGNHTGPDVVWPPALTGPTA